MDQFFKELREIQKKERANSSLARVGSDFYKRTYKYLDKLKARVGNDPFSNEHYLLKDIQRIATEICERREHKINDAAVMNIQRSYHLFKGKPKFDLLDTTPLNLTNEEEKLYFSLIDTLKTHRQSISLDKLTEGLENDSTKTESKLNNLPKNNSKGINASNEGIANDIKDNNVLNKTDEELNKKNIKAKESSSTSSSNSDDTVLNRLNSIKKAKVIENEKYENINEQINKPLRKLQATESKSTDPKENKTYKKSSKTAFNSIKSENDSKDLNTNVKVADSDLNIDNILKNEDDQFVELNENFDSDLDFDESMNVAKNIKIVNKAILIFKKVGAIVGVDEKVYGPFYPQDIVVMPNVNANIIIKSKKGRLVKI